MSTDHRDRKTRSSFFAHKFTITSFVETDPVQWNKEWDKALHPFSAKDVYAEFSWVWTSATLDSAQGTQYAEFLKARLLRFQNTVAGLWADLSEEHNNFITAWLLLEERDRQTHLLNGLLEACKDSSLGVDARAMCPDIKISSMLKWKGRAYVNFIGSFTKGKMEVGENGVYEIPSQWWETAVDLSDTPSQEVNSPFARLTIQRNEFISESIDMIYSYLT
jgi:hypothetical protein